MKLTLARTIACADEGCRVQLLADGSVIDASFAPRIIDVGIRIRPGMIVALDSSTTPPVIRWRFGGRPVEALAGDRMTLHGREFRFVDARPEEERAIPIGVGDTVIVRSGHASDEVEVFDTVEGGQPRHPELLEAEFPQIEAVYQGTAGAYAFVDVGRIGWMCGWVLAGEVLASTLAFWRVGVPMGLQPRAGGSRRLAGEVRLRGLGRTVPSRE
jgi:hypothetical protein